MGIEYVDGDEDILIEKEGKEEKRRILVKHRVFRNQISVLFT